MSYDGRLVAKEMLFSVLALASVGLLLWEYLGSPNIETRRLILRFDFVVAVVFLTDYLYMLARAKHKRVFIRQNWFLLLASIPLLESWVEALRALRILALVRLLRTGEHVLYAERLVASRRSPVTTKQTAARRQIT